MTPTTTLPVIALNALLGNPVPTLNAMQLFLAPYVAQIIMLWWFIWVITLFVLIRFLFIHGIRGTNDDRELYSDS